MTDYILRGFKETAEKTGKTIADAVLEYEKKNFGNDKKEVYRRLANSISVFHSAVKNGLADDFKFKNILYSPDSIKLQKHKGKSLLGKTLKKATIYALAITENNLSMGKVIACPTAGASGIVPACILAVAEETHASKEDIYKALLTASAIELSIVKNASISGAVDGCQAECGSATAMAAGAIVQLMNKGKSNPEMVENAAALALKNMLGLVCDPVAGVVSVPCRKRNATSTGIAFISAELALSGVRSYIPFDEVVTAMSWVGRDMNDALKETSRGGLAKTPSGKAWEELKDELVHEAKEKGISFSDILLEKNSKGELDAKIEKRLGRK